MARLTQKWRPFVPEDLPTRKVNWEKLIPLIGPANRALANFNGILYGLPNADVLLAPLTTQEAVLSSRIEGTQATLGDVLKFEAGDTPAQESQRADIQEILNYRRALRRAEKELKTRPFNLNLLVELHSILLDSVRGLNKGRGCFRRTQNWIGASGCSIQDAAFVPPDPALVLASMSNWEKYYHADRPDLLVQLAIMHAQFEIIHPFLDGNGRLGRILVPLFLFEKGLLTRPVFYLSGYIEKHKDEYIARLRRIGTNNGAWNEWIVFFLTAVAEQAKENLATARSVMDLYERLKLKAISVTHSEYAVPLLDVLFERPILSTAELVNHRQLPSKQSTMIMIGKLKKAGILTVLRESSGRRPQILAFPELLNLCEAQETIPLKRVRKR